tara:strand:+ start:3735 stop:4601 length:867 start_codon:yes stop_codon:yes gene_type:complete
MAIGSYCEVDVAAALKASGVRRGDLIYMPSAFFALGRMEGISIHDIPERIVGVVKEFIGPEGTLTVPASFDDYARFAHEYDTKRSPVDAGQGAISQYVANLPDAFRSYCPLNAVAGIGPLANEVCHGWTGAAYGVGSAWDRLYENDAKFVCLGVAPNQILNFVYYVQQRFGVPHLYNKLFTTPVYEDGVRINLTITSLVRYLDTRFTVIENTTKFENYLTDIGLIRQVTLGRGNVYVIESAKKIFSEAIKKLSEDVFYFLEHPPKFVEGEVPMDGPTGKMQTDKERYQ